MPPEDRVRLPHMLEAADAAPDVPWSAIVGMRNRLVHAYFDVDTDVVWKTVTNELPALRNRLQALL